MSLASSTNRKLWPRLRSHPPGQVRRVDRQAVPADARARGEPHEPERLRRGRVDRLPHVDAQAVREHRQLVDERDVDVPERVLEQLGQLGGAGTGHRHDPVDDGRVERRHGVERSGVHSGHHLGRGDQGPRGVARVDPLGAVAEVEVGAGGEPGPLLQDRRDQVLGRPRVGGRLQRDRGPGPQEPGQRPRGLLDVPEVGDPVAQRRRYRDHRDVEPGARTRLGRRPVRAAVQDRPQLARCDVLDVRLAGRESLDPLLVHVVPDDLVPDPRGANGEREPDVALADDDDPLTHDHSWA